MRVLLSLLFLVLLPPTVVGAQAGPQASPDAPLAPQGPPASLLLAEVHYHAPRDAEYVILANPGPSAVPLRGWRLTDGEGLWEWEEGRVPPGGRHLVADNATALWEDGGLRADACRTGCASLVSRHGRFALNNGGDEVALLDPRGVVVDAFRYGTGAPVEGWEGEGAPPVGRGRVARRRGEDGLQDTDAAADWAWERTFRVGQSRRSPPLPTGVLVQPVLADAEGLQRLVSLLAAARHEVLLSGFKLTNAAVVEALEAALWRGVWVQVGLEGRPPGGWGEAQEALVARLGAAGARVLLMEPGETTGFRRYAVHHAKYVVVDGTWVLLGSENFSERGYPLSGDGNRGWSVVVQSASLAASVQDLVGDDWDAARSDVRVRFEGASPRGDPGAARPVASPGGPWASADARLLLSPDNALSPAGLPRLLRSARASLDVELFYLRQDWGGHRNPLLDLLVEAARRGVRVRLLLDGSPYNLDGDDDNDEAVRLLNGIARGEGLPLEARLLSPGGPRDAKLHNKGLVVDRREVWISSMNWNFHGAYENREASLHLASTRLAAVYQEAFEGDWAEGVQPREADPVDPPTPLPVRVPLAVAGGAAALLWFRRLRMGEERTNKHRRMKRREGAAAHRGGGD